MAKEQILEKTEVQKNYLRAQEEQKTLEFIRKYQELCKEYNRTLIPQIKLDVAYINAPSHIVNNLDTSGTANK